MARQNLRTPLPYNSHAEAIKTIYQFPDQFINPFLISSSEHTTTVITYFYGQYTVKPLLKETPLNCGHPLHI